MACANCAIRCHDEQPRRTSIGTFAAIDRRLSGNHPITLGTLVARMLLTCAAGGLMPTRRRRRDLECNHTQREQADPDGAASNMVHEPSVGRATARRLRRPRVDTRSAGRPARSGKHHDEEEGMRLQRIQHGIVISIILMSTLAWAIDDGDPQNGLSSQAFRRNALTTNKKALEILRNHALNDALFTDHDGYIGRQLQDPNARAMMSEIVKCALNDGTSLSLNAAPPFVASGELGLCQDWRQGAPNERCQQLVTACVMARVNALQKAIPLWLRGYQTERPSGGPVNTVAVFRESLPEKDPAEGIPIPSFGPPPPCSSSDCNWKHGFVGKCGPGDSVALRLDAPANQKWEVRVCAGIHGCTELDAAGAPPYSWRIGEFSQPPVGTSNLLTFRCPVELLVGGYYSVMTRSDTPPGTTPDLRANSGVYPAPRKDVFGFLEGAFFGNMFLPDKLTRDCEVAARNPDPDQPNPHQMTCRSTAGNGSTEICTINCGITSCRRDAGPVPYTDVHACYSFVQQQDSQNGTLGVAYLNSRICDRPDGSCFPEPPGPCIGDLPEGAGCTWDAAAGAFANCSSPAAPAKTFPPITTYLNEPCDLIGVGTLCNEVRVAVQTPHTRCDSLWWVVGRIVLLVLGGVLICLLILFVFPSLKKRKPDPR
jgi:hypothetical protein